MLNLAHIHEAIAEVIPDRECLVFRDRRLTWKQTTERTRRLAEVLRQHGLGFHTPRAELSGWEGELVVAQDLASRSLAIRQEVLGDNHPAVGHSQVQLAMLAQRAGDLFAAGAGYQAAQSTWAAAGLGDTDMATRVRVLQGGLALDQGDVAGAVALFERAAAGGHAAASFAAGCHHHLGVGVPRDPFQVLERRTVLFMRRTVPM